MIDTKCLLVGEEVSQRTRCQQCKEYVIPSDHDVSGVYFVMRADGRCVFMDANVGGKYVFGTLQTDPNLLFVSEARQIHQEKRES